MCLTSNMKKYSILLFLLFAIDSSCKLKKGIPNFVELKWEKLGSITTINIYQNGKEKLTDVDSIGISYVGRLNKDGSLTKVLYDSIASAVISKYEYGNFLSSNTGFQKSLKEVLLRLNKKSIAYLKWKSENGFDFKNDVTISAYLKQGVSDKMALAFCEKLKNELFFDSVNYISSKKAIEKYTEGVDSTWISFLESNPLPSSIQFTLNKNYLNKISMDSICNTLRSTNLVNEIQYPQKDILEKMINYSVNDFIIKIETY